MPASRIHEPWLMSKQEQEAYGECISSPLGALPLHDQERDDFACSACLISCMYFSSCYLGRGMPVILL